MNKNRKFDGFAIELFIDEDNDWLAHFIELPNISAFGSTIPLNALIAQKLAIKANS